MQLTLWTYEGPPHVGAMRVATAMRGRALRAARAAGRHLRGSAVHHDRTPRRSGPRSPTRLSRRAIWAATRRSCSRPPYARPMSASAPQAMLVGASCTAELIQDDPGGLARALDLPIPVIPLELPAYQKKENWGAAETFYQLVARWPLAAPPRAARGRARRASALQSARADRARLPPSRRRERDRRPARAGSALTSA